VRIDNLSFTYAGTSKPVLRELTLRIPAGEVVLLTGPSGCGKSTLALALAGLIPARINGLMRGAVYLDAAAIGGLSIHEVSQRVGIVFQNPDNQLVNLSVEEEVAFGPENLMLPSEEIERRVTEALEATGILALRHEQIYALSGGQKQRVAIAGALAMRPQVLVLDEPTSDLDPVGTQEVLAVLRRLNERDHMSIVLIEHKIDEVISWVHRVLLMDRGAIVLDAAPARAFADRDLWQSAGVAVPQLAQVAYALPEIFAGAIPLSVDDAYRALEGTAFTAALRAQSAPLGPPLAQTPPPPVAGEPLLRWQGVGLAYDLHQVLFDIDLGIWPQEWVALIGANGSGKTSLASLVMGFQSPTRDSISVQGKRVKTGNISRQAHTIAYLFQAADTMLFAGTVEHELLFGLRHRHAKSRDDVLPLERALEITDLTAYRAANPFHLSHGQRKRLAIGALLMRQPSTLILDEPTTGQDEGHARVFFQFLEALRTQGQLTYLMITHDMRAVARYASRVVALRAGRVALDGPPDVVFARRNELAECGIVPPPIAHLHARLCDDQAQRVALRPDQFLRMGNAVEVIS
jgi:energy-coupling factor transport system ATP-binding protein